MPMLKNGSEVSDVRLDRIQQFDERSRNYPIRATIDPSLDPRSYTWRCDTYLNQGSEGACVGFSMTHELIARPKAITGLDGKFAREQVYWEAQKIDPWEGGAYPDAGTFYEGTSVLAGIKTLKKLGYIDSYRWCFGLDDLVMAVGYRGPVILGVPWYSGMFEPMSCGHLHVTGYVAGGHAILCKGVSVKNKTFTLHNSWGSSWGNGGEALIHWDEMERLLYEGGEACVPEIRTFGPE